MNDRLFNIDAARRADIARALSEGLGGEPHVVFAYLHGSFIGVLPFHDIDVAVYLNVETSEQTRVAVELADRLSRRVGYPVDVRALNSAPVPFVFRALQGQPLVSHDDDRLLVHTDWKLDYDRVYDIMRTDLGDLRSFSAAMAALI